jgi:hypothetical protein
MLFHQQTHESNTVEIRSVQADKKTIEAKEEKERKEKQRMYDSVTALQRKYEKPSEWERGRSRSPRR